MEEVEDRLEVLNIIPIVGEVFMPLDADEVSQIEESYRCLLPEEYKWFLRKYGASTFEEYVEFRFLEDVPSYISDTSTGIISHFFGSSNANYNETLTLKWNLKTYERRVPKNIIPIGSDGGGNLICMGILGNEKRHIYYWDHTNEWEEEYSISSSNTSLDDFQYQNLYLISKNFQDFLMRLEIAADKG